MKLLVSKRAKEKIKKNEDDSTGITALVCGILSICFSWTFVFGLTLSIVALTIGSKKENTYSKAGKITGIIGLILSILSLIIIVIEIIYFIALSY